ncbi:hypothetical protein EVAR_29374_1 [Eumeta japonica]|uniref:Uncharacterized protein n=1 Tax=Eumeta variegata TaxID=151549 RepID=A0A4C1YF99_EUMVA|nr:hypothetical protein EVAR_29374_1 [Eumeta japonica]
MGYNSPPPELAWGMILIASNQSRVQFSPHDRAKLVLPSQAVGGWHFNSNGPPYCYKSLQSAWKGMPLSDCSVCPWSDNFSVFVSSSKYNGWPEQIRLGKDSPKLQIFSWDCSSFKAAVIYDEWGNGLSER